jgi:hypothetical protein
MISDRDLVTVEKVGLPISYGTMPRADAERAIEARRVAGQLFTMTPVPTCRCCGEPAWENLRCTKHQDRNPCAVEGCTRTRKANGYLSVDSSLCGEHWKAFVPPGSPIRRAFNRLARLARKMGYKRTDRWPPELERRWWLIWFGVIRRVRRGDEGHVDQAAIHRMFGWDDSA